MAQNSSRLHRLLTLLDTGSTQTTRFAAARQIGEIAKSHPQELNALLKKVSQYTHSKSWDTRVAAAHAIGAITENVKHTSLKDLYASVEAEKHVSGLSDGSDDASSLPHADTAATSDLAFGSFDINRVLEFGSPLLASGGQEYDIANDNGKNPAERLARQKKNLWRRLVQDWMYVSSLWMLMMSSKTRICLPKKIIGVRMHKIMDLIHSILVVISSNWFPPWFLGITSNLTFALGD